MSPRFEEFLAEARARLQDAHGALAGGFGPLAVSAAYYAKTHSGTWSLFRETFVRDGRFDAELVRSADQTQELREAGDDDARAVSQEEAAGVLAHAEEFVQAVERLLSG